MFEIIRVFKFNGKDYIVKGNNDDETFIGVEVVAEGVSHRETIAVPRELVMKSSPQRTTVIN